MSNNEITDAQIEELKERIEYEKSLPEDDKEAFFTWFRLYYGGDVNTDFYTAWKAGKADSDKRRKSEAKPELPADERERNWATAKIIDVQNREKVFRENLCDPKELMDVFDYDPETGIIRWKKNMGCNMFKGRIAGGMNRDGYLRVIYKRQVYSQHRLAWALHYGEWPHNFIDHINHVRSDNRIKNLRDVDRATNNRNALIRKDNKTGYKGVRYCARDNRFIASIRLDGKQTVIGYFDDPVPASAAYEKAAQERELAHEENRNE